MQHALTAARTAHRESLLTLTGGLVWLSASEVDSDDLVAIDEALGCLPSELAMAGRWEEMATPEDIRRGLALYLAIYGDTDVELPR